jgi:hypothetical protein
MGQPGQNGPSSFHFFTKLPTELRLYIWSLTLSRRIIDIYAFNKSLTPCQERNPLKGDRIYTSQSSIPILYICRESRDFALRVYRYGLDTEDQNSSRFQLRRDEFPAHVVERWNSSRCYLPCRRNSHSTPGEIRPRIYFNLQEDTLCLNGVWWCVGRHPLYPLRNYLTSDILLNLQYLALPFEMFAWAVSNDRYSKSPLYSRDKRVTLADFANLKEIIINMDCSEDERGERDPSLVSEEEITEALEDIAEKHPGWKIPKWRLVRDRASLGRVVERGLLT